MFPIENRERCFRKNFVVSSTSTLHHPQFFFREERELRQRKRRDEKNQQTAEVIQKIKRTMQEKELAAASYVMHKKSLIAIGISAALLGYYWLFG